MDNALQTILEMLEDRGYDTIQFFHVPEHIITTMSEPPQETDITLTTEQPPSQIMRYLSYHDFPIIQGIRNDGQDNDKDNILVFFVLKSKIGISMARQLIQKKNTKSQHAILVYGYMPSHRAKEELEKAGFELFQCSKIYHNLIRHHKLIPRHEALTPTEENQLLQQLNTTKDRLPGYSQHDPVVQYYNWPVGTVVRIHRKFGMTQDSSVYYRVVRKIS